MKQAPISHNNNFNFLRLIGALLVIVSHTYYVLGVDSIEPVYYLTAGKLEASGFGLCIFFFISGYFVSRSAARSETVAVFSRKRIFRIYPLLIVLVLLTVFVLGPLLTIYPVKQYFSEADSWKYLYTATGLRIRMNLPGVFTAPEFFIKSVNASLWTISLEVMLYITLVILLVAGVVKQQRWYRILSLLIATACFAIVASLFLVPEKEKYFNLVGIFFLGGFCSTVQLTQKKALLGVVCCAVLFILLDFFAKGYIKNDFLLYIVTCLFTWMLGYSKRVSIRLKNDISYGLYMIAFPVQQLVFMFTGYRQSVLTHLGITLLIIGPLAFLSWKLLEKPMIAIGRAKK